MATIQCTCLSVFLSYQVILERIKGTRYEGKKEVLDKLMEMGRAVSLSVSTLLERGQVYHHQHIPVTNESKGNLARRPPSPSQATTVLFRFAVHE